MKRFKPQVVAVRNESLLDEIKEALANVEEKPEILAGEQGVIEVGIYQFLLYLGYTDGTNSYY